MGSIADQMKLKRLLGKRERQRRENAEEKERLTAERKMATQITDKFASYKDEVEDQIKASTFGLVSLNDMRAKQSRMAEDRDLRMMKDKAETLTREEKETREKKRDGKRKRKKMMQKLSFAQDDDGQQEDGSEEEEDAQKCKALNKSKKGLRDLTADSSYLPNAAKNEDEMELRKTLRGEWEANQEIEKNRVFTLPYDYWDGTGHRFEVVIKKGNTIQQFLSRSLEVMKPEINDLRHATPDHMIFVKNDLILPHYYTFYEMMLNNVVSRTGMRLEFESATSAAVITNKSSVAQEPAFQEVGKPVGDHFGDNTGNSQAVPKPVIHEDVKDPNKLAALKEQLMHNKMYPGANAIEIQTGEGLAITKEGYAFDQGTETSHIEAMTGRKKGSTVLHMPHATIEVKIDDDDESSVGRVILRSWYEKNKHIFPASRWEAFDPVTMVNVDELQRQKTQADADFYSRVL